MSNSEKSEPAPSFYLTCDECGHNVDFACDMTRDHIGYPCPRCAADMLTEEDFLVGVQLMAMNKTLIALGLARQGHRGEAPGEGEEMVRVHHHAGKTTIEKL
ncbi:hypothetical protein [Agrobacterium sp. CG674]